MPASLIVVAASILLTAQPARADYVWVEGEKADRVAVTRHPSWYDQVKRAELSGGDFITNWGEKPGVIAYRVSIALAGERDFWVRANPTAARLSYRLNGGDWDAIDLEKGRRETSTSPATASSTCGSSPGSNVGRVELEAGRERSSSSAWTAPTTTTARSIASSSPTEPFTPRGTAKPGEASMPPKAEAENDRAGSRLTRRPDPFAPDAAVSTCGHSTRRSPARAASSACKGDEFIHSKTGEPVRFWAVNGPAAQGLRRPATRGPACSPSTASISCASTTATSTKTGELEPREDRPRPSTSSRR